MKTFSEFNKEVNEAAVALKALPYAVKAFTKVAPMVAPKVKTFAKFATSVPVGLGIANVLQSKKVSDMSDDEIARQGTGGGTVDDMKLGKNPKSKREKFTKSVKNIIRDVKKGLSVDPKDVTAKKYNPNAEFVRKEMKKRAEEGDNYAKRWMENMKRNRNLQDSYVSEEGAMAVPTNNVGGGMIAGTVEAGDDPPKKKRNCKTYAYGGVGSRKMWMPKKA